MIPQRTCPASRGLLFQSEVRSVFVIVGDVIREKSLQWRSFKAIVWSSNSRRQLPTQRSATPFCQGLLIEVRTGVIFSERIALGTSNPLLSAKTPSVRPQKIRPDVTLLHSCRKGSEPSFWGYLKC